MIEFKDICVWTGIVLFALMLPALYRVVVGPTAIDRIVDSELFRQDFEDLVRRDVERMYVVPVDQRCLDRAARLARDQPVRLADALHLAAADRLPRPLVYLTVDAAQIPVALSLGFDVRPS